jgi:15-cis-phytoene synthase
MYGLYESTTFECSKIITTRYSSSFSLGIKILNKRLHYPIYGIYGFVRYADEIVDTFHYHKKDELLMKFREETYKAIEEKISLNPVLHSFQKVVNDFGIGVELIEAFFESMEMDLTYFRYSMPNYRKYIFGSAEVVGLMCLKVFCNKDEKLFKDLSPSAKKLGNAFQKVNFLRDIQDDYVNKGRVYFPDLQIENLTEDTKISIVQEIEKDFEEAYQGIRRLPNSSKAGVYLAYIYYLTLLKKIKKSPVKQILNDRIRIPTSVKMIVLAQAYLRFRLNLL